MNSLWNAVTQNLVRLATILVLLLAGAPAPGQETTLQQATLFSRIAHQYEDYGKSAYNFYAKARSDKWPGIIKNRAHLIYGNIAFNYNSNYYAEKGAFERTGTGGPGPVQDSDWFAVSAGGPELTRIKDLGPMQWSDVRATPFVPVTPHSTGGIRMPGRGESYEQSSENRVTKVVAGHMYVIHIKGPHEDFYVMLRVDELVPNDQCTISWKVVPPPKKPTN